MNLSEILIKKMSLRKIYLKMSSMKGGHFVQA